MMKREKKKIWRKGRIAVFLLGVCLFFGIFSVSAKEFFSVLEKLSMAGISHSLDKSIYPEELIELLEKNEETYDFVVDYPENKDKDFEIDLSEEAKQDGIPLLLQWDERWGYVQYGSNMIALTGCGPTCLSMVYIGLTGDASMHPKKMAKFSEKSGYYTENGTSWDLMTEGAEILGLSATELPLDEVKIKEELRNGKPVICSMGKGDFTTQGHFIVLTGVDKDGNFLLNDPNSKKNSSRPWEYARLASQIKNLWSYEKK